MAQPHLAHASSGGAGTWLPQRPTEPHCAFYLRHGTCAFGLRCRFHHPPNRVAFFLNFQGYPLNFQGYPLRPGEKECAYYVKTGTCKFRWWCRFHHPQPHDLPSCYPLHLDLRTGILSDSVWSTYVVGSVYGAGSPPPHTFSYPASSCNPSGNREEQKFPMRPGEPECSFYMKTGNCKFGANCKFHHPPQRRTTMTCRSPDATGDLFVPSIKVV